MDDDDDDGEGGGSNTPSKERGRSGRKGSYLQRFREWLPEMLCNRAFLRLAMEHFEGDFSYHPIPVILRTNCMYADSAE